MPRRPAPHRVKRHQVYTVAKAAEVIGMNRQTVTRWIVGKGGAPLPAARDRKPWLIRGDELKRWLIARKEGVRTRLGPGEIYCLPCRRPVRPDGGFVDFKVREGRAGMLLGLCPHCGRMVNRAVREADACIAADLEVTRT